MSGRRPDAWQSLKKHTLWQSELCTSNEPSTSRRQPASQQHQTLCITPLSPLLHFSAWRPMQKPGSPTNLLSHFRYTRTHIHREWLLPSPRLGKTFRKIQLRAQQFNACNNRQQWVLPSVLSYSYHGESLTVTFITCMYRSLIQPVYLLHSWSNNTSDVLHEGTIPHEGNIAFTAKDCSCGSALLWDQLAETPHAGQEGIWSLWHCLISAQ